MCSSTPLARRKPHTDPATTDPDREAHIDTLNARQRTHLRSLAHHLKPVFQIGKDGITEPAVQAIADAFNTRELVKVKVQESAPMSASASGEALAARVPGAHHVQTIGRTVVIYRPHPEHAKIELP